MLYVIGTYSDDTSSILGQYASLKSATRAINWQGQPRGDINWKGQTRAETWDSGSHSPDVKTQWVISKPSYVWGHFEPLDGGKVIKVSRSPYTAEAFKALCDTAYDHQIAF